MDRHSDVISEDNSSAARIGNARLLITHEGLLDKALLRRTEGYMHKKGGAVNGRGGFRNWKKRWFVIAEVEVLGAQGYELQYYDAPHGNLKGKVGLSEIEIQIEAKSQHKNVKHEFQISLQNGGTLELSCDDLHERDEWIETLNMITTYLRKVLTTASMTLDGYDPYDEDDEISFNIGEEIGQNCQAFGPGLFGAEAGVNSQFVIQVHDLMGQQVTRGGMPITATLSNQEAVYYIRVIDNDDGTYFCQYVLGRAGQYHLTIRLNDEHDIFGSPFNVEILPSKTIARYCVAEGEALNSIVANETQTFTITAMDGFGNKKKGGGDPFEVGVMGPAQLRALTDNNNGTYTCTIAAHSPAAASYVTSSSLMIMITLHGKSIAQSPFKPIITEDLRSLYANNANNANSSNRPSIASASVVSVSTRGASTTHSKHAMAQSTTPPPHYTPSDHMSLAELDGGSVRGREEGSVRGGDEASVRGGDGSVRGREEGSVRGSVSGRNNNISSSNSIVSNRAHTPPPNTNNSSNNNTPNSNTANNTNTTPNNNTNNANNNNTTKLTASAAALTALATTGNAGSGMGGGLSRLERSRQRALLAKALSESGTNNNNTNTTTNNNNTNYNNTNVDADMGTSKTNNNNSTNNNTTNNTTTERNGRRLTKLEELQRSMSVSGINNTTNTNYNTNYNTNNNSSDSNGVYGSSVNRNEAFFSTPQVPQPQHVSY